MVKIVVRITAEVLGSPKEHVDKTLQVVLDKLPTEEGVKVITSKKYETKQMEGNEKLWSTFAEVEFETDTFKRVLDICYDYMPSTIEILEPAGMDIDCRDLADFMNDYLTKLHKYSMVLKKMQTENIYMMKKLKGEID
jgi:hypothetical protein